MPRSSSLLSPREWPDFGRWLEDQRQHLDDNDPRKPLAAMARALDRNSTPNNAAVKCYLTGKRLPGEGTVRILAHHLGLPERTAVLRAGYLISVLREISDLVSVARAYCARDRVDFAQCMTPNAMHRKLDKERYARVSVHVKLPGTPPTRPFVLPWPATAAVYCAIKAFPLRGEQRQTKSSFLDVLQTHFGQPEDTMKRPGQQPHELQVARRLLPDAKVDAQCRRAAAGEFVRAWIRRECGAFADAVIFATYIFRSELAPLRLSTRK